jgi:hypothetical protein
MAEESAVPASEGQSAPPEPNIIVTGGPEAAPAEPKAQEAPASQESGEEAPPKQPSGKEKLNKRFSELTRTIYEERARREAVEQELSELRARAQSAQPSGGNSAPKLEDFKDYEEYAEAKARWVAAEEIQRATQVHAQRTAKDRAAQIAVEIRSRWDSGEAEAREKFEDYDEVMADPGVKFSEAVSISLLDSEVGPQLAYYLKSNPEEARKLAGLSPVAAARAVGKLELKLSNAPAPKPTTSAPPPPKPVTASAPTDGLSDRLPVEEWIRRRNKEVLDRRRHG